MLTIMSAEMSFNRADGYVGQVEFTLEGHKNPYAITLQKSRKAKEWSYGLHFSGEPGSEDELFAAEDLIEDNDELYEQLVEAAKAKLSQREEEDSEA
ncbi:hypothetical protein SY83_01055 [Paenibacillus swuensis]|uniref:Uncharacterized protein n=2 Tax=Paenibacillus swuensis TaxID=1178515 RepID=A0A172TNN7_9BACL|nr:hypothetical protein SY83_01055 [Paenibacillus swuensis]